MGKEGKYTNSITQATSWAHTHPVKSFAQTSLSRLGLSQQFSLPVWPRCKKQPTPAPCTSSPAEIQLNTSFPRHIFFRLIHGKLKQILTSLWETLCKPAKEELLLDRVQQKVLAWLKFQWNTVSAFSQVLSSLGSETWFNIMYSRPQHFHPLPQWGNAKPSPSTPNTLEMLICQLQRQLNSAI